MRIGIDLGGTKIEGIVLDDDGAERLRHRIDTPPGDYDRTIAAISELVDMLAAETDAPSSLPVGVGIPGAISPATGLVKNANSTCLIGRALDIDLETALGRPVRLANDADCFTISEAIDGAGSGANTVFGVILGTGVGGGIAVSGKLLAGINAIAGEWGHNPLPWMQVLEDGRDERPGEICYCGQSGCIETFLSGPGMTRDHQDGALPASEIVALTERGDTTSIATLTRYEHRLARALASVINIIDPDVIVLGGGLSNIKQLYTNIPKIWSNWVFSDETRTELRQNMRGDSGGVRGAAWLWE